MPTTIKPKPKEEWVDPRRDPAILRPLTRHRIKFSDVLATAILRQEAKKIGVDPQLLVSRARYRDVVWARQDAIWRIYNEMDVSYIRLGLFMSMHHTTILHCINRALSRWLIKQAIYQALEDRHHAPRPSIDRPDVDRKLDRLLHRDTARRLAYEKRKQVTD